MANPMLAQKPSRTSTTNEDTPAGRSNRSMTTKGLAASTVNMLAVQQKDKTKARSSSNDRLRDEDVNVLYEKHENLIETLLLEEDKIIDEHKSLIDSMINSIKNDSILFQNLQSQRILYHYSRRRHSIVHGRADETAGRQGEVYRQAQTQTRELSVEGRRRRRHPK